MTKKTYLLSLSLLILLSILSAGCLDTPKEPVFPNWDVDLNIPITQRTYLLADIIDQESNPNLTIIDSTGSDSLYAFILSDLENTSPIVNSIKIPVALVPENLDISGIGSGDNDLIYSSNSIFRLDTAEFRSGSLYVFLINKSTVDSLDYIIKAPGFKKKTDKSILKLTGSLAPGQTRMSEVPLVDYIYTQLPKYAFNTDSTQKKDGILIRGLATTSGDKNIDFIAQVANDEITLSRLVGKIMQIDLGFNEQEVYNAFGEEAKDFKSKIKFKGTQTKLTAVTIGSLRNLKIIVDSLSVSGSDLISKNTYGTPYYLMIKGNKYYSDTLYVGETKKIEYDESDVNIIDFLTRFPDLMKVRNKFILDNISANKPTSISDRDSIKVKLNISAPAILALKETGREDTLKVEISDDDRTNIVRGVTATISFEVENHIAIGLLAKCVFVDKDYNPLFTLRNSDNQDIETFELLPANVDVNGYPVQPGITKLNCVLNSDEFQKFKNTEYVIVSLKLHSTGSTSTDFGPFVRIRAKDFLRFKMYGGVNYNLDPENMK
jgi:hypothetical protein